MHTSRYTFRYADTGTIDHEDLSEFQWFEVFVSGHLRDRPLVWIERTLDRDKRVTFSEHADGQESL